MNYGEERYYAAERRNEILERQADALESLADQGRIQNGLLLEQTRALEKLVAVQFTGNPADVPSSRSLASSAEDGVLDLTEQVDLDAVGRVADE